VPPAQELGRVSPSVRNQWVQSLSSAPSGEPAEALLRLEMAAEVPTPPEQLDARRALQLKLLTKRNEPGPAETWAQDAARVLASAHEPTTARRLQSALKPLLRKG
jgi:transposase-like protein